LRSRRRFAIGGLRNGFSSGGGLLGHECRLKGMAHWVKSILQTGWFRGGSFNYFLHFLRNPLPINATQIYPWTVFDQPPVLK
jgi:hypothetical protein